MLEALSWGVGLQSTTLAVMSVLGDLEPYDLIVTADTQWEKQETYEIRDFYRAWLEERGATVHVITAGSVKEKGGDNHIHIPFWTQDGGPMRRQCTRYFKIRPIRRHLRKHLGYPPSHPPAPPPSAIRLSLGISTDEYQRMKTSQVAYTKHRYPLCTELMMSRADCRIYLERHDLPVPVKSACIGCPYTTPAEWHRLKQESPAEFAEAIAFDEEHRQHPLDAMTTGQLYLHRDRIPLKDITEAPTETAGPLFDQDFCESGYCHV